MTSRDLLLRAYPRSWREEYGEELAAIWAQSRLTPRLTADLLINGVRQHFLRDAPWKFCGAGLALWLLMLRPVLALLHEGRIFAIWYFALGSLLVSLAGALTVRRQRASILAGAKASAKATLLGTAGFFALYFCVLLGYRSDPNIGPLIDFWFAKTVVLSLTTCLVLGFLGALLAPQSH